MTSPDSESSFASCPELLLAGFGERELDVAFLAVERNDLCLERIAGLEGAQRFARVRDLRAEHDAGAKAAHIKICFAGKPLEKRDLHDAAFLRPVGGGDLGFERLRDRGVFGSSVCGMRIIIVEIPAFARAGLRFSGSRIFLVKNRYASAPSRLRHTPKTLALPLQKQNLYIN